MGVINENEKINIGNKNQQNGDSVRRAFEKVNNLTIKLNDDINTRSTIKETGNRLTALPAESIVELRNADNEVIDSLSVAFLNNEGTTLKYNSETREVEIWNDFNEMLSSFSACDLLEQVGSKLKIENNYELHLMDSINGSISSVTLTSDNIQGLQEALETNSQLEKLDNGDNTFSYRLREQQNLVEGDASIAFGKNNTISGVSSFVMSNNSTINNGNNSGAIILGGHNNVINNGNNSAILGGGQNTISGGEYGTILNGFQNELTSNSWGSVLSGANNSSNNSYSMISGYGNEERHTTSNDGMNIIAGTNNLISGGAGNAIFGIGHIYEGYSTLVTGQASETLGGVEGTINRDSDPRFIVGNGEIERNGDSWVSVSRSNALVVYHSGLITAPSLTNELISNNGSNTLITKGYVTNTFATIADIEGNYASKTYVDETFITKTESNNTFPTKTYVDNTFVDKNELDDLYGTISITNSTTLTSNHKHKTILCNGNLTVTIPSGLGKNFTVNLININDGTGVVTIANGSGVNLISPHGRKLLAGYTCNILKVTSSETFHLQGELTA